MRLLDWVLGNLNGSPYTAQIWDVSSPNEQYLHLFQIVVLFIVNMLLLFHLSLQDISPPPAHKHAPLHIMVQ